MNERELEKYDTAFKAYKRENYDSSDGIKRCLIKNLAFRRPQLINTDCILALDKL